MSALPPTAAHAIGWWEGAGGAVAAALLGALIGSFFPTCWAAWGRRKERSGEIVAMQVEMALALRAMTDLFVDDVAAPLYHLPLTMFSRALPKLIGEKKLLPAETVALVEYVVRAEELNRGLDLARAAAVSWTSTGPITSPEGPDYNSDVSSAWEDDPALAPLLREFRRNRLKAQNLMGKPEAYFGGCSVFEAAKSALYRLSPKPPPMPERG